MPTTAPGARRRESVASHGPSAGLRTWDHQNPAKAASQPAGTPSSVKASARRNTTRPRGSGFSRAISSTGSLMSQATTRAASCAMNCVQ